MKNVRTSSAKIIQTIIENKVFFADLKKQVGEKDLSFVNMLVLTTLRNWQNLENELTKYLNKKIPNKHRFCKYLVLTAMAELIFMNTPSHIVINETVKNVKNCCDKFLGGMANAILRRILQNKEFIYTDITNNPLIPQNFQDILEGYSDDEVSKIKKSINMLPPLNISVKNDNLQWKDKLKADIYPNGTLSLKNAKKVQDLSDYNNGSWWIQDVAASLPVQIMGDIKGLEVIDLCAAPGGKTAQLLNANANVTALDISEVRLDILKQNMKRLGFENIKTQVCDAVDFMNSSDKKFDAILLDAPCSATGTFRRHPEVLYIKGKDDVKTMRDLQKQLLSLCRNILKIGGTLVYSVCSIAKDEGEYQISEFLKNNPDFKLIPISIEEIQKFSVWNDNIITTEGTIRTLPFYEENLGGLDSFFICKMQRII